MNTYTILITPAAKRNIIQATDYITHILKNPTAADHLLQSIQTKVSSLSDIPTRLPLVDEPVLRSWGIRILMIQNYYAFYTVSESRHQVTVIRFLYAKRNWVSLLKQNPADNQ